VKKTFISGALRARRLETAGAAQEHPDVSESQGSEHMAKGQQRKTKEARKPKKEKPPKTAKK